MPVAVPVAVSVTETAAVAGRSRVAVTVTVPPPSATVLSPAVVVSFSVVGAVCEAAMTEAVTEAMEMLL